MTTKSIQVAHRRATFAQLDLAASEALARLNRRSPTAVSVLLAIVSRLGASGGIVVISRATIGEICGVSVRTIDRALNILVNEGYVQRIRISGAFGLAVNARVAWTGKRGELLNRAVFQATVVASRAEQDEQTLNPPQAQRVPVLARDELPAFSGEGLTPPSQPALKGLEPVLYQDRDGNKYDVDPDTGEIQQRLPD